MKYAIVLVLAVFAASVSAKAIDTKGFLDDLLAGFNQIYEQVLFPAVNTQVQNVALLGAQLLAGLSQTGISGVEGLFGKRDLQAKDFWSDLSASLMATLMPTIDTAFQSLSLTGAQLLAQLAMNGLGKRDAKGLLDDLTAALNQVYQEVLFPAINTQVQNVALLGAQLLAGLSQTGLSGATSLFGKRDFFSDLYDQLMATLMPVVDSAFQSLSLTGAQLLAQLAMNGLGKRDAKGLLDDFLGAFQQVYDQVLFPAINTQVQNVALLGAQLLAGLSQTGTSGLTSLFGK